MDRGPRTTHHRQRPPRAAAWSCLRQCPHRVRRTTISSSHPARRRRGAASAPRLRRSTALPQAEAAVDLCERRRFFCTPREEILLYYYRLRTRAEIGNAAGVFVVFSWNSWDFTAEGAETAEKQDGYDAGVDGCSPLLVIGSLSGLGADVAAGNSKPSARRPLCGEIHRLRCLDRSLQVEHEGVDVDAPVRQLIGKRRRSLGLQQRDCEVCAADARLPTSCRHLSRLVQDPALAISQFTRIIGRHVILLNGRSPHSHILPHATSDT